MKIFVCMLGFVCLASYALAQDAPKMSIKETIETQGWSGVIYFPVASCNLDIESRDMLERAAKLHAVAQAKIRITGHADITGNPEHNLILSKDRANSARKYLLSLGAQDDNIALEYEGDTKPLVDDATPEAYAKNRRVEIVILAKDAAAQIASQIIENREQIIENGETTEKIESGN